MKKLEQGAYHGVNIGKLAFNGLIISHNQYPGNSTADWHYHENPHFTFIMKGKSVEKRKKTIIHCVPGTLLFYSPLEAHSNERYQHGCKHMSIEIEENWFKKFDIGIHDIHATPVIQHHDIKNNFVQLLNELKNNDPFTKLGIEGLLLQALASVKRANNTSPKIPHWLKQVNEILHEQFTDLPSLREIGRIVNVHPVTISKEFPKYYQCTLGEYTRKLRIEKAMALLGRKTQALEEIAIQCGFYDTAHFSKIFKKHTRLTPAGYRQLL